MITASEDSRPVGTLDITLYRDLSTLGPKPVCRDRGRLRLLQHHSVDDVLYIFGTYSCRLGALFREGRPKQVQLCVLIDRDTAVAREAGIGRKVQTTDRGDIGVERARSVMLKSSIGRAPDGGQDQSTKQPKRSNRSTDIVPAGTSKP